MKGTGASSSPKLSRELVSEASEKNSARPLRSQRHCGAWLVHRRGAENAEVAQRENVFSESLNRGLPKSFRVK